MTEFYSINKQIAGRQTFPQFYISPVKYALQAISVFGFMNTAGF